MKESDKGFGLHVSITDTAINLKWVLKPAPQPCYAFFVHFLSHSLDHYAMPYSSHHKWAAPPSSSLSAHGLASYCTGKFKWIRRDLPWAPTIPSALPSLHLPQWLVSLLHERSDSQLRKTVPRVYQTPCLFKDIGATGVPSLFPTAHLSLDWPHFKCSIATGG